ncbi:MAG: hypothetical protein ACR2KG_01540 [Nocardioidaceae bacterium]
MHQAVRGLQAIHDVRYGDYVAWLVFGVAAFGAAVIWQPVVW